MTRSVTDHKSLAWIGSNPTEWIGAVNPLPDDVVIGSHVLTLTNVVVDSRVHIESQDGTTIFYDALAAASTVTQTLNVYGASSALNDWRIRIRKGSAATYYQPYETLMTATVGSSSIFVSQVAD